jgi:hypothetical protein
MQSLIVEEEGQPMSMIGFPLLLIPLAIVNIVVFLMSMSLERLGETVVKVDLPSLQPWTVTYSDLLLAFALFLLFFEIVKSARPGAKFFTDHLLSFLVFAAAAAEFLMLRQFAHSTFFLLTLITFADLMAGIAIRAVRPKMVPARGAREAADYDRPAARPEPAPAAREPSAPASGARASESAQQEARPAAEPRDVPIAPNQEVLPPEPSNTRH